MATKKPPEGTDGLLQNIPKGLFHIDAQSAVADPDEV